VVENLGLGTYKLKKLEGEVIMIQCLKNDKNSMNNSPLQGETSFYNISNSQQEMR
jgi:hypothetical protein